ncbi:MAG: histidine phosphatase family protein [Planctomycetaceae bacterium]|nr:histidine phosphatase family protein [Planctomycetaceae bacterium]
MIVYIVRHAWAEERDSERYPDDNLRPLTRGGSKRFARVARKLAKRGVAPTIIATSPLVRCRQTAEILAARMPGNPPLVELAALAPSSRLETLLRWNAEQAQHAEVAWVGHAPDVEELAATLIGDMQARLRFNKGSVAAIECAPGESGFGTLLWLATARLLGC